MIRLRPAAAAALALVASGLACAKSNIPPAGARFGQPSAVAVFVGRTIENPLATDDLKPYLVVANAAKNDLSIVDAVTDVAVAAPIKLQSLVVPVQSRPSLLASASLGDGKSDLLVVVAGGTSVLQVVETWNSANLVHSDPNDPKELPIPLAVDLKYDVVALAAMPPDPDAPGTARVAAALADSRVAIVTYVRGTDQESIVRGGDPAVSDPFPFQPLAIAAMPDDPDVAGLQTALYVASIDPVCEPAPYVPPGPPSCATPAIPGVAEISVDLSTVRALGARAPTRLVAAARLQERLPGSAASDGAAFGGQPRVPRVYAVLDESGCGASKPIDCGIVTLDPTLPPGAPAIPPDYAGLMPYRAPMHIQGRALAIAASGPPQILPPVVSGEPDYSGGTVPPSYMRLYMGSPNTSNKIARATTGVAVVASDNGNAYFLDLGRFETATSISPVTLRGVNAPRADYVVETTIVGGETVKVSKRLWIQTQDLTATPPIPPTFVADADAVKYITVTPGFTPDESWAITYQGLLPALAARAGEVGLDAGQLWLALQVGDGPAGATRIANEVVRLWDPNVAVRKDDILVIKAAGMPAGCVGTRPYGTPVGTPDSQVEKEFQLEIGELLAPTATYPGGAVSLVEPPSTDPAEWDACYKALVSAATGPPARIVTGLTVTVRGGGLVLTGASAGYAGRPVLGQPFSLTYPSSEDALAAACPLDGWTGALPAPACDPATCRPACETLVLARKARRLQNIGEDCTTDATDTTACAVGNGVAVPARWPPATYPFPIVNGPVLAFQVDVQLKPGSTAGDTNPIVDMNMQITTSSGVFPPLYARSSTAPYGANGAIAFDRSVWTDPVAGYRFYVSYPANVVLDTTPSQTPAAAIVIQ